jgi:hypothetical protein
MAAVSVLVRCFFNSARAFSVLSICRLIQYVKLPENNRMFFRLRRVQKF